MSDTGPGDLGDIIVKIFTDADEASARQAFDQLAALRRAAAKRIEEEGAKAAAKGASAAAKKLFNIHVKAAQKEVDAVDKVYQAAFVKFRQAEERKTAIVTEEAKRRTNAEQRAGIAQDRQSAEIQRRITYRTSHEQRKREIQMRFHRQIIVKTWASMLSNLRLTNETAQRAIARSAHSFFARRRRDRAHEQSLELVDAKAHANRLLGVQREQLRQTMILNRQTIRSQGAVSSFQTRNNQGAIGSILSLRNVMAGFGAYISGRWVVDQLQSYEQVRISITNLLGDSEEAADRLLDSLRGFATQTPFEFSQLADAARRLLAIGESAQEIIPDLTAVGDVAALVGASGDDINHVIRALGQMGGAAKVSAQDLNQITQALPGFNVRANMARVMGVSVAEAMDMFAEGAITGREGVDILIEAMATAPNAAGAMQEQMQSLQGAISNFHDELYNLTITTLGPFIDEMANAVRVVTQFIDNIFKGKGAWTIVRSGLVGIGLAAAALVAIDLAGYFRGILAVLAAHPFTVGFFAFSAVLSILIRDVPQFSEALGEMTDKLRGLAQSGIDRVQGFLSNLGDLVKDDALQRGLNLLTQAFHALMGGDFGAAGRIGQRAVSSLRTAFSGVVEAIGNFVQPIFNALRDVWDRAFEAVSDWFASGGVDQLVQGFFRLFDSLYARVVPMVQDFFHSRLFKPALAGVATLIAASIFGWGPVIIAGVGALILSISPTLRDRLHDLMDNILHPIGDFLAHRLPVLFLAALYSLGEFLGGPVIDTIFGPVGQRIILGITTAVVAGAAAFLYGFLDAIRRSIPDAIGTLADIFQELITGAVNAARDALGPLANAFILLEVPLRGIIESFHVLAEVIGAIPTPVFVMVGAIYAIVRALKAVQAAQKTGWIANLSTFFSTLPYRVGFAAVSIQNFSDKMKRLATGNAARRGFFGVLSRSAEGAATAVNGLSEAMPVIGTAAAIGIPIALGLIETAKARSEAWKREIKSISDQFSEGTSPEEWITTDAIKNVEGFAEALNDVNVQVQDFANATTSGRPADIGRLFASMNEGLAATIDELGISMDEFGRAALEGDNAVDELAHHYSQAAGDVTSLGQEFREIPDALRDVVDKANEASETFLDQQFAAGNLTDAQVELYVALKDGQDVQATYGEIAGQVSDQLEEQQGILDQHKTVIDQLNDRWKEATDNTASFTEAIDNLTGSAIEVGRSQQNIEGIFDAIHDGIMEGQGINDLGDQLLNAADGIIGVFQTLSDAGRPREAVRQYSQLRERLIDTYVQLGLDRDQAREFTSALIPPVGQIRREMRHAQEVIIHGFEQQRRRLRRAIDQGLLTGDSAEAAEQYIDELNVQIAAAGGLHPPFHLPPRRVIRQAIDAWFGNDPIEVPIQPIVGGGGANGPPGLRASTGSTGIGGIVPVPPPTGIPGSIQSWRDWSHGVSDAFKDLVKNIGEAGRQMERVFGQSMRNLISIGTKGATEVVRAITGVLSDGSMKVQVIVHDYAVRLANNLNPLLAAIGQPKVSAFAEGAYRPRIAEGREGPQVHVFNEAGRYGEAYVPFDPRHRGKARDIANQTVGRLGGRVQWFAEGGITQPVANVTGDWTGLNPEFARRLSIWATALGDVFNVTSGFRTYAEQVAAYQRYLAGNGAVAAVPGTSMHEFGLAADGPHWGGRGPGRYRLVYPMSFEPWHVEPVEGRGLGDGGLFVNPLPTPPGTGQHGWLSRVASAFMQFVYNKALTWAGGIGFSAPVVGHASAPGNILAGIRQAMGIVGVPASWLGPLLTLIERESGYNPRAYNGVLGASGLMQTIPSTFAAHALPGYGNIFGIVDNVIAGLRYILDRYGTIFNVGQAVAAAPTNGYRLGGYVGQDGPAMVHRGEFVIPADLTRMLGGPELTVSDIRASLMAGGGGGGQMAPVIGSQTVNIHSNASDPEAVGVVVNSRLRSAVAKVRR